MGAVKVWEDCVNAHGDKACAKEKLASITNQPLVLMLPLVNSPIPPPLTRKPPMPNGILKAKPIKNSSRLPNLVTFHGSSSDPSLDSSASPVPSSATARTKKKSD